MQSGQSAWRIPGDDYYMGPPGYGNTYRIMNDGSVQVLGQPDLQTPIATLRVGYMVVIPVSSAYPTGATLRITAISHAGVTGAGSANGIDPGNRTSSDGWSVSFSDGSTWWLYTIARYAGAAGQNVLGWTQRDVSQTQ